MRVLRIILRILKWLGVAVVVIIVCSYGYMWHLLATSSVTTHGSDDLNTGNILAPSERTKTWAKRSSLTDSLLLHWSQREIKDWADDGKVTIPRILIGKLATHTDVTFVNQYLQEREVRGTVGSTGPFHKTGDYDFTLAGLSLLLHSFGDNPELLHPESVEHIVEVLMTQEGGDPIIWTPRVLGLPLRDTENHILMTEGSRYLKNRWNALHGDDAARYDNATNGLEAYLHEFLHEIERAGFHEYNSRPYQGYTMTALLNLEAFAAPAVQQTVRGILDRVAWRYALGSLSFRRFPPFRRQARQAKSTDLDGDYLTAIIKAWMSTGGVEGLQVRSGAHQALWVCLTDYRPPDVVAEWIVEKPEHYFVRMGHGWDSGPELYSGGPGYLITAGGVARDRFNQSVSRPTTLLLDDDAMDLEEVLHVSGPGERFRDWNNTGVHRDFAVAAGPVSIPDGWDPEARSDRWQVYQKEGIIIVVYSTDDLGLFCLFHEGEPDDILSSVRMANSVEAQLTGRFTWPSGRTLTYNVASPKDQWVMTTADGDSLDREHTSWPLLDGDVPGWTHGAGDQGQP